MQSQSVSWAVLPSSRIARLPMKLSHGPLFPLQSSSLQLLLRTFLQTAHGLRRRYPFQPSLDYTDVGQPRSLSRGSEGDPNSLFRFTCPHLLTICISGTIGRRRFRPCLG